MRKKARKSADQWKTAVAAGLVPPEAALETAAPVFDWLNDLDAQTQTIADFNTACESLTLALDEQIPVEKLEVLYNHIERLGQGVPEILESRYRNRQEDRKSSQRSKLVFKIVALVVIIGTLATGGLMLNRWNAYQNELEQFRGELVNAITQSEPDSELLQILLDNGTQKFPSEMHGVLAPDVRQANSIINESQERGVRFAELYNSIASDSPLTFLDEDLDMLTQLARTDSEKRNAERLLDQKRKAQVQADAIAANDIDLLLREAKSYYDELQKRMSRGIDDIGFVARPLRRFRYPR